jgi:hypothetical protein
LVLFGLADFVLDDIWGPMVYLCSPCRRLIRNFITSKVDHVILCRSLGLGAVGLVLLDRHLNLLVFPDLHELLP